MPDAYVSLMPMGHRMPMKPTASVPLKKKDALSEGEWKKRITEAEERAEELQNHWYLEHVPSFEVWCAATCYDPAKSDGGVLFQKMMYWVLTRGHDEKSPIDFGATDTVPAEQHAPRVTREMKREPKHLTLFAEFPPEVAKSNKPGPTPTVYGPYGVSGDGIQEADPTTNWAGNVGFLHSTSLPYRFKQMNAQKLVVRKQAFKPGYQMQWYNSTGLSLLNSTTAANSKCDGMTNQRTYLGQAAPTGASSAADQTKGCMHLGNRFAAFYGLYYYPEDDRASFNWYENVETRIDGRVTKHRVRMRMVNPAYIIEEGKLYVQELVKEVDGKFSLLAFPKFEFPRLQLPTEYRGLCWDSLVQYTEASDTGAQVEGVMSEMGPWVYSAASEGKYNNKQIELSDEEELGMYAHKKWSAQIFHVCKNWSDLIAKIDSKWQDRMWRPTNANDLRYGWSTPAALWHYPHYTANSVSKGVITAVKQVKQMDKAWLNSRTFNLYQPWPTEHKLVDGVTGLPKVTEFDNAHPLVLLLERAPLYNMSERQKYALGRTYKRVGPEKSEGTEAYRVALLNALGFDVQQDEEPEDEEAEEPAAPPADVDEGEQGDAVEGLLQPVGGVDAEAYGTDAAASRAMNEMEQLNAASMLDEAQLWVSVDEVPEKVGQKKVTTEEFATSMDDKAVSLAARQNSIKKVIGDKRLPLPAGAERQQGNAGGNAHFKSLLYSPWPPTDVYHAPVHGFTVDKPMTQAEIDDHIDKYQNVSNTLLRANVPTKLGMPPDNNVIGVEKMVGSERVLDMPLSSYTDTELPDDVRQMFARNMRCILAIYYDESGDLGMRGPHSITSDEKRKGMQNGIYRKQADDNTKSRPVINYDKKGVELLPPVFTKKPKLSAAAKSALVNSQSRMFRAERDPEWDKVDVRGIISNMTVLQWLQTPWHYEYLPYQPMNSVFQDGETYCNGCTRCSRPFYDYKYLYASYAHTPAETRHWVHAYWYGGKSPEINLLKAPKPFHEDTFWSKKEVTIRRLSNNVAAARDDIDKAVKKGIEPSGEGGTGYHNWPTHLFLLGYREVKGKIERIGTHTADGEYNNNSKASDVLRPDWNARNDAFTNGRLNELKRLHRDTDYWTFRKYLSHTYSEDRKLEELVQGVVRNHNVQVTYGMKEYRLMRSIKYGNVCRDCMSTLDRAPLQYRRTGGVSAKVVQMQGVAQQTRKAYESSSEFDTWWFKLAGKPLKEGSTQLFDPWFLFLQTPAPSSKPQAMGLNRRHTFEQLKNNGFLDEDDKAEAVRLTQLLYGPNGNTRRGGQMAVYAEAFAETLKLDEELDDKKRQEKLQEYVDLHLDRVIELNKKGCQLKDEALKDVTKVVKPPEVYVQKMWDMSSETWNDTQSTQMRAASEVLKKLIDWLDGTYTGNDKNQPKRAAAHKVNPITDELVLSPAGNKAHNRALRDALYDTLYTMGHTAAYKREATATKFDPDRTRLEERDVTISGVEHCLRITEDLTPRISRTQYDAVPQDEETDEESDEENKKVKKKMTMQNNHDLPRVTIYPPKSWVERTNAADKKAWADGIVKGLTKRQEKYTKVVLETQWDGDPFVQKATGGESEKAARTKRQERPHTQSRLFITYSLHRRVFSELEARAVLEKMANAIRLIFGNDSELCDFVIFGKKLKDQSDGTDSVSLKQFVPIEKPNKQDKVFYGGFGNPVDSSYLYDTYQTHIELVTVDAGVEIGPTYHHPHFHVLVTFNHFTYLQIDTMHMKAKLEKLFKGVSINHQTDKDEYMLVDGRGLPFYTDNENAYTDIRVYPSDNWADVIAAYVRKGSDKESMMSMRARTEKTTVVL